MYKSHDEKLFRHPPQLNSSFLDKQPYHESENALHLRPHCAMRLFGWVLHTIYIESNGSYIDKHSAPSSGQPT